MWKIVLAMLGITAAMMMARLIYDPPVLHTRAGLIEVPALPKPQTSFAFAGIRG